MAQKVKRFKQGSGVKSDSSSSDGLQNVEYRLSPSMGSGLGLGDLGGGGGGGRGIAPSSSSGVSFGGMSSPVGKVYGVRNVPVGGGNLSFGANPMSGGRVGASYTIPLTKKKAKGGKLTDLTGDGKVTRADVLKGRGVPGFKKGSKVSAVEAVHKHERAKHKGQPLTKMAKGGSTASKRGDGCATKGKTKGRMV